MVASADIQEILVVKTNVDKKINLTAAFFMVITPPIQPLAYAVLLGYEFPKGPRIPNKFLRLC